MAQKESPLLKKFFLEEDLNNARRFPECLTKTIEIKEGVKLEVYRNSFGHIINYEILEKDCDKRREKKRKKKKIKSKPRISDKDRGLKDEKVFFPADDGIIKGEIYKEPDSYMNDSDAKQLLDSSSGKAVSEGRNGLKDLQRYSGVKKFSDINTQNKIIYRTIRTFFNALNDSPGNRGAFRLTFARQLGRNFDKYNGVLNLATLNNNIVERIQPTPASLIKITKDGMPESNFKSRKEGVKYANTIFRRLMQSLPNDTRWITIYLILKGAKKNRLPTNLFF